MRAGFVGRPTRLLPPAALLVLLTACQTGGPPAPDPGRRGDPPDPPAERAPPAPSTALALAEPTAAPGPWSVAAGEARPQAASHAWQDGRDCLAILAGLRAAEAGSLAAGPPPVAALLPEPDRPVRSGAPRLRIDADLPLSIHRGDGGEIAAPCLLVVAEPERPPEVERRVTGPERVASAYVSDVIREANPDYEAARIRARQAERRLGGRGGIGAVRTGDPLLDLIGTAVGGLLGSLDALDAEREFEEAVAALKDTPPRRERPVYQPYHYERLTIHASKRAAVPTALVDRERDRVWSARLALSEEREFHRLEGLHPKDRDLAVHGADGDPARELELWERAPPEVRLSALVDGLVAAAPSARPAGGLATPPARLDAVPAAAESGTATAARLPADPRVRSVVRVAARAGAGSGFYVAPELVLTSDRVTDGATVVDVALPDGATVPGLVLRRDRRRDLALIKVPKPGPPLALYAGAALEPGSAVEAAGHPQGPEPGLARGVVGAVRHVAGPGVAGLRDVLVIETDAALSAGGPLLQGEAVVGVATWSGAGQGGANLAVHHREVREFLLEAGV